MNNALRLLAVGGCIIHDTTTCILNKLNLPVVSGLCGV